MKKVYEIDASNFFTGNWVVIRENEAILPNHVEGNFPEGLYKPKYNGSSFTEGATQAEIDAIRNATPTPDRVEELKKQQTDLVFELMIKGVL